MCFVYQETFCYGIKTIECLAYTDPSFDANPVWQVLHKTKFYKYWISQSCIMSFWLLFFYRRFLCAAEPLKPSKPSQKKKNAPKKD